MNLQEMIKQKKLTNYKVAKEAKIGQSTICELTSGKRKEPRYSTAVKIANVLGVKTEKIFEAIEEGNKCKSEKRL